MQVIIYIYILFLHIAIIEGREEYPDLDLVFPWRTPHFVERDEHTFVRPWYVKHEGEEIRVTVKEIKRHYKNQDPLLMTL